MKSTCDLLKRKPSIENSGDNYGVEAASNSGLIVVNQGMGYDNTKALCLDVVSDELNKYKAEAYEESFVDLYPNLFLKCLNNSDTLQINAISEDVLTTLIERLDMSQEHQQIFKKLFKENRMSEEAVQKLVVKLVPEMQDVFDYWANSGIALLTLTSVGIVIGAQYAKIITGQDYDLNIWI